MSYFLPFLAGSGFALGGRPLPGTFRIASRADWSYKASAVIDSIPSLCKRIFTVLSFSPSFSDNSSSVKYSPFNFIPKLSENVTKRLHLLNKRIVKFAKKENICDFL